MISIDESSFYGIPAFDGDLMGRGGFKLRCCHFLMICSLSDA